MIRIGILRYRTLIVDDEALARERIRTLLEEACEIEIIGERYKATPQREPLFDPQAERMRG